MAPRIKLKKLEPIIIEAYTKHNRTLKELALFHYVCVGTIQAILRRNGVPARSSGRKRNDGEDLKQYQEKIAKLGEGKLNDNQ